MAFLIIFILIPPSSRIRPPDELQGPPLHYFEISIYGLCTDFERVAPRKIAFFRSKFFLKMPKTRFLAFFSKKMPARHLEKIPDPPLPKKKSGKFTENRENPPSPRSSPEEGESTVKHIHFFVYQTFLLFQAGEGELKKTLIQFLLFHSYNLFEFRSIKNVSKKF